MNKRAPEVKNHQAPTSLLRELWLGTCARYTVLCLLLLFISAIAAGSLTTTYVDTVRFFLLLPFALCITLATRTRRSDKLSTKPSGQQILLILLLTALLYGAGMAVICLVSRTRRRTANDTPYVSQFGNK